MPFCQGVAIPSVEAGLSAPRLASYSALLATADTRRAIGAYLWSLELNAALSPLLGTVEVVLRNAIHSAATTAFGRPDWLQDVLAWHGDKLFSAKARSNTSTAQQFYRPRCHPFHRQRITIGGATRQLKRWNSHVEAKRDGILKALQDEGKPNTPDQIVAHAMFGFWLDLLQAPFEDTAPFGLWPRCLPAVFPHDATMTRQRAEAILLAIKRLRNRVSHHEPAWSIARPMTPIGVQTHMRAKISEMEELLNAMNPNIVSVLKNAGNFQRLHWLLEPQTISSFAAFSPGETINLKRLNRTVRKVIRRTADRPLPALPSLPSPYHVIHRGRPLLALIPYS